MVLIYGISDLESMVCINILHILLCRRFLVKMAWGTSNSTLHANELSRREQRAEADSTLWHTDDFVLGNTCNHGGM